MVLNLFLASRAASLTAAERAIGALSSRSTLSFEQAAELTARIANKIDDVARRLNVDLQTAERMVFAIADAVECHASRPSTYDRGRADERAAVIAFAKTQAKNLRASASAVLAPAAKIELEVSALALDNVRILFEAGWHLRGGR